MTTFTDPEHHSQLKNATQAFFVGIFARECAIDSSAFKPALTFESYGINSVMIVNLTRQLEQVFGGLSKTLFFEYQTLEDLCTYFIDNHS